MSAGPPVLRDAGILVGFVLAIILSAGIGLYLIGWVLWCAIHADWMTVAGWLNG